MYISWCKHDPGGTFNRWSNTHLLSTTCDTVLNNCNILQKNLLFWNMAFMFFSVYWAILGLFRSGTTLNPGLGIKNAAGIPGFRDHKIAIPNRERKCADTIGTVLVPWAGHFQCWNINILLQIKYMEAILSNSIRKLSYIHLYSPS